MDKNDYPSIETLVSEYTSGSAGTVDEAVMRAIEHPDAVAVIKAFQETPGGFDPNSPNGYYESTLNAAVESFDEELVTHLLSIGADPNRWYGGKSPLECAAEHRGVAASTLSRLLGHGADTDRDRALHWAAAAGSADKAEILLKHGMDVKAIRQGPYARAAALANGTPLHEAAGAHYIEASEQRDRHAVWDPEEQERLIRLLLDAGADPQGEDDKGNRPEDWVTAGPGYKEPIFKQLADPLPKGEAFDETKHLERIKALLKDAKV